MKINPNSLLSQLYDMGQHKYYRVSNNSSLDICEYTQGVLKGLLFSLLWVVVPVFVIVSELDFILSLIIYGNISTQLVGPITVFFGGMMTACGLSGLVGWSIVYLIKGRSINVEFVTVKKMYAAHKEKYCVMIDVEKTK